jgi:hypothetical protein
VLSLARQVREDQLWAGAGTGKGWSVDGKVLVTKVGGQSDQRVAQSKGSSLGWVVVQESASSSQMRAHSTA